MGPPHWIQRRRSCQSILKGLPDRLKDRICEHGRPSEFVELRSLALALDGRHWERHSEMSGSRNASISQSSPVASTPRINTTASSPSTTFKPSTNQNTKPDRPKIPGNQVTSSGHLTEEEKQRRRDLKLCMYCGSNEHLRPSMSTYWSSSRIKQTKTASHYLHFHIQAAAPPCWIIV